MKKFTKLWSSRDGSIRLQFYLPEKYFEVEERLPFDFRTNPRRLKQIIRRMEMRVFDEVANTIGYGRAGQYKIAVGM